METSGDMKKKVVKKALLEKRQVNRCFGYQRKVGLTEFKCQCGELFCANHQYFDRHDCSYGARSYSQGETVVKVAKIVKPNYLYSLIFFLTALKSFHAVNFPNNSMAALSTAPLCHSKHNPIIVFSSMRCDSRTFTIVSCQNRDSTDAFNTKTRKGSKEEKGSFLQRSFGGVEKLGKGIKDNLSPERKGDWKDLALMSLSFAVYVYMSQKIVCAYCAWMSMLRQSW
ncbi:UNVERIFIED_CONTAM: Zinc finger A20 and AN1 domain-containing stress-associated protein 5 [Sesamum radiatum]|uniref:Zinc finger A20 and AN1 domain-containing stress-associated protein 5 n=1 Tax=Sesamum radiatum TaxID=300843 RepID=A0AAW2V8Q4_SESRA